MGTAPVSPQGLSRSDWTRLHGLPWGRPLDEWPDLGVQPLSIRSGESRHSLIFLEVADRRYAIKETSPVAAEREISALLEMRQRGCKALEPVGYMRVRGEPLPAGEFAGLQAYFSGDNGYCITRLAEGVLPQSILYRYPFTEPNKRLLWNAVVELLLDLHNAGVYWGDPSLANVLIDLRHHRLTAILADAETAEVVTGELDEGLRQHDLEAFIESAEWQAEDIRIARGLGEDAHLLTSDDGPYISSRYAGLRQLRSTESLPGQLWTRLQGLEYTMQRLNALGFGVLNLSSRLLDLGALVTPATSSGSAAQAPDDLQVGTLRRGWYVKRLHDLLGVRVPRAYALRLYQHLMVHKWILSEHAERDTGLDAASADWLEHYHRPLVAFLHTCLPFADELAFFATYLAVLDHTWQMSKEQQRPVPIEEGAMDYALAGMR